MLLLLLLLLLLLFRWHSLRHRFLISSTAAKMASLKISSVPTSGRVSITDPSCRNFWSMFPSGVNVDVVVVDVVALLLETLASSIFVGYSSKFFLEIHAGQCFGLTQLFPILELYRYTADGV